MDFKRRFTYHTLRIFDSLITYDRDRTGQRSDHTEENASHCPKAKAQVGDFLRRLKFNLGMTSYDRWPSRRLASRL